MSYILDALKHSQDSRSRGAVPDLASQTALSRLPPSRSERLWRVIALLAVLLLLALLVSLGWQRWLAAPPAPQLVPPPLAAQPAPSALAAAAAPAVTACSDGYDGLCGTTTTGATFGSRSLGWGRL